MMLYLAISFSFTYNGVQRSSFFGGIYTLPLNTHSDETGISLVSLVPKHDISNVAYQPQMLLSDSMEVSRWWGKIVKVSLMMIIDLVGWIFTPLSIRCEP